MTLISQVGGGLPQENIEKINANACLNFTLYLCSNSMFQTIKALLQ